MKQIAIIIFALFTLSVMPNRATSSPKVYVKKGYYSVSGQSATEIREDLNKKTPVRDEYGMKYDAETKWYVKWNFWWNESNGTCSISKVETRVDVSYTLPDLKRSEALPKALNQKWGNYIKALVHHENGHKDFGVRAAWEIEKEIKNMKERQTCKQLENDANALGYRIIKQFSDLEKLYDQNTNHGMNRGAIFP